MDHNHDEYKKLIEKALNRSALKAREIALQTNTPIVIEEGGEVKHIKVTGQDVRDYRESIKDSL